MTISENLDYVPWQKPVALTRRDLVGTPVGNIKKKGTHLDLAIDYFLEKVDSFSPPTLGVWIMIDVHATSRKIGKITHHHHPHVLESYGRVGGREPMTVDLSRTVSKG